MPNLISVIIPVYNRKILIKKAIESVLNQSFSDFELIVIDDCSTDGTDLSINLFDDSRLTYFKIEKNSGNAVARNKGIQLAKGEFICFLDSDDYYEPDYLEKMVEFSRNHPSDDFFWTGIRLIDKYSNITKEEIWEPKELLPGSTFFDSLRIGTNCGVCFRKSLMNRFGGFDESLKASVDREFFLRISQTVSGKCLKFHLVNCLIGNHNSVRKDKEKQAESYQFFIAKYASEINQTISRRRWWYHKAMWLHFNSGKRKEAIQYYFKIPFQFKSLILFLIYFFFPLSKAESIHKRIGS